MLLLRIVVFRQFAHDLVFAVAFAPVRLIGFIMKIMR